MAATIYEDILEQARHLTPEEQERLVEDLQVLLTTSRTFEDGTHQPSQSISLLGLVADLGPAPSAAEIDEARREAWSNFPREDI